MKNFKFILIAAFVCTVFTVDAQPKAKAERPYTILERGQHMTRLNIVKDMRGKENTLQIEALNASGGTLRLEGPEMLGADISNVLASIGSYNKVQEVTKSGRGHTIQLQEVVYPLRVRITISNQVLEVYIKEEGFWRISVGMNK